jgi:hypothetical protein
LRNICLELVFIRIFIYSEEDPAMDDFEELGDEGWEFDVSKKETWACYCDTTINITMYRP